MKSYIWLCTYNNPKVEPEDYLRCWHTTAGARYVCGQVEQGEAGTPHIQYYLNFSK